MKNHTNGTYLSLIDAVMAMKAFSTLVASFALASMNGMPISSANACDRSDGIQKSFKSTFKFPINKLNEMYCLQ